MERALKILNFPGLYGSGPTHWQTYWEAQDPTIGRIEQADWDVADHELWLETVDRTIEAADAPVIVVAHSMSCTAMAYWAKRGKPGVVGALMVAPTDVELPNLADLVGVFAPVPLEPLPFETIVVNSTNDVCVSRERGALFARSWGGELIEVGPKGHINAESDIGDWPEGRGILQRLIDRVQATSVAAN